MSTKRGILSVKVWAAQRRLVELGFRQGEVRDSGDGLNVDGTSIDREQRFIDPVRNRPVGEAPTLICRKAHHRDHD